MWGLHFALNFCLSNLFTCASLLTQYLLLTRISLVVSIITVVSWPSSYARVMHILSTFILSIHDVHYDDNIKM